MPPVPGVIADISDYLFHLYAAVTLAAPYVPELAALRPGLIGKMKAGGAKLIWRDSFAV